MLRVINGQQCLVDDETGEVIAEVFFKTPNNYDRNAESDRVALHCPEKTLTQQHFKDETDINIILARYQQAGMAPPMAVPEEFRDISEGRMTYFELQQRLADASAKFYMLDPKLRYEHSNDPTRWADAVVKATEEGDRAALRKLGLDAPDPTPEPPTPTGGTPDPVPAAGASQAPKNGPGGP